MNINKEDIDIEYMKIRLRSILKMQALQTCTKERSNTTLPNRQYGFSRTPSVKMNLCMNGRMWSK